MLSRRLASSLLRTAVRTLPKGCQGSAGAAAIVARKHLHTSPSVKATSEVASILEERILGTSSKAELEETGR
eukprot:UN28451